MSLLSLPMALMLSGAQVAPAYAETPVYADPVAMQAQASPAPGITTPSLTAPSLTAPLPPCPAMQPLPATAADVFAQPVPLPSTLPGEMPATSEDGIVVTARPASMPGDPMAELNAQSYQITQDVDEALVGPVAMAYKDAIPKPIRHGLRNFLRNIVEPIVAVNFLLQLKPGKAAETIGRFAVNTTIGVGGLFDVARREPFNLPHRRNGFANTLGYYGVEPGPYLFLPLIGPTTVRDLIGGTIDGMFLPTVFGKPFNNPALTIPEAALSALQGRIQIDEQLKALREQSNDPYIAARDFYLRKRQAEIDALRGRVPYPDSDLPFVNPGSGNGITVVPVAPIVPPAPVGVMTPGVTCVPASVR